MINECLYHRIVDDDRQCEYVRMLYMCYQPTGGGGFGGGGTQLLVRTHIAHGGMREERISSRIL